MKDGNHTLLMGESGVGKSVIIQQLLNATVAPDESMFVTATSNYSAQTTPKNLRVFFEAKLEKKRKTLLGPPAGKTMLSFIDDLNMPGMECLQCNLRKIFFVYAVMFEVVFFSFFFFLFN